MSFEFTSKAQSKQTSTTMAPLSLPASPPRLNLTTLPQELVLHITTFLPAQSSAILSVCHKSLHFILPECRPLLKGDTKTRLLELLLRDMPLNWCQRVHGRKKLHQVVDPNGRIMKEEDYVSLHHDRWVCGSCYCKELKRKLGESLKMTSRLNKSRCKTCEEEQR